jgi:tetratricopeptide (TPR) repeat protein
MVYHRLRQFEAADACFAQAVALKRALDDRRSLAGVLINLSLLRASQERRSEIRPLAEEAMQLAQETQSDEPLATAHAVLGLAASVEHGDVTTTAEHYALAVTTAWEYHPATGRRINRYVLRHLHQLLQHSQITAVRTLCEHILQTARERLGAEHPEALRDFEEVLATVPHPERN